MSVRKLICEGCRRLADVAEENEQLRVEIVRLTDRALNAEAMLEAAQKVRTLEIAEIERLRALLQEAQQFIEEDAETADWFKGTRRALEGK